ncbi:CPBP family intramembrane glutamic endopeptidase [Halococcoides cellulosivorans]|uniref:CAAX prenyl protease 2/Lysostaphin resistance protein A-like domain-containing protein n=1 Tax=Halococcoides cellulosivorans TaxID=1679096 RepID=A0A2R4X3A1_9EURY|nr:type II CAAX endopeptidase family protein [Halococcoides cellulosivorans]AWB28163.1 hypothetical protein HARCEL1_10825 [Halococcoides cellulosivorans]
MATRLLTAVQRPTDRTTSAAIAVALAAITLAELLLYGGHTWPAISVHALTLSGAVLVIGRTHPTLAIVALVPLFRLVNLAMPVFFSLTVFTMPVIYGPLIPSLFVVDRYHPDIDVRPGWRVGLLGAIPGIAIAAALARVEWAIIRPEALIAAWTPLQVLAIVVVMVGFVGFVEEYLFRGLLQRGLAGHVGRWPAVVLASAVFAIMHSGYHQPGELVFAGTIGFVFGALYEWTDSLALIVVMHGALNVVLFAVIPIFGTPI